MDSYTQNPDKAINDAQGKLLDAASAQAFLMHVKQREWEKKIAGELLLLQEVFGIDKPTPVRPKGTIRYCRTEDA